jgi:hypothetical protein
MKKQRNQSIVLLISSLALLFTMVGGTWNTAYGAGLDSQRVLPAQSSAAFVIPTISIVSVQVDQSVTITSYNFPANDTYNVLMNFIGTRGVGGINVGTVNSGAGGSLTWTFNIPTSLKGQQRIAIRTESRRRVISPTIGSGTRPAVFLPPGLPQHPAPCCRQAPFQPSRSAVLSGTAPLPCRPTISSPMTTTSC